MFIYKHKAGNLDLGLTNFHKGGRTNWLLMFEKDRMPKLLQYIDRTFET